MEETNKKELSERHICSKFITPAIKQANWNERQIREEVNLTKGRIIVKGSAASRGKPKRADYIRSYKPNLPLAVVEAKRNIFTVGKVCSRRSCMPRCWTFLLLSARMGMPSCSTTGQVLSEE